MKKWIPITELLIFYKINCDQDGVLPTLTGWIKYWRKTVLNDELIVVNRDGKIFRCSH